MIEPRVGFTELWRLSSVYHRSLPIVEMTGVKKIQNLNVFVISNIREKSSYIGERNISQDLNGFSSGEVS